MHLVISSAPAARMEWMDVLRGGAIVLVVAFHAVGIPWWYYDIPVPEWAFAVMDFFGPFRMPALVLLSGMLLGRALAKPPRRYLAGKARTLIWPFVVWAALEALTVSWLTNGLGVSVLQPALWLSGGTHLWFLLFLTGYYLIALVVRRVPAGVVTVVMWGAALAASGEAQRFLYLAGFFFAGHAIFIHQELLRRISTPPVITVLAVGGGMLGVAATRQDVLLRPEFVPLSLAGIVAAMALAQRIRHGRLAWLRAVGRDSIVYYLPHLPVELLVVKLLLALDLDVPVWLLIALAGTAGLLAGGLLARYRHTPAVRWLFEWPVVRQNNASRNPVNSIP